MFRSMNQRIGSREPRLPWGLICVLVLFAGTAFYPLLPERWGPPRRARLSADRNLDRLVYEIYWGDISQVRQALRRVRNINQRDETLLSPLGHAAVASRKDAAQVARMLIDLGADVHVCDSSGNTPFDHYRMP